MEVSGGGAAADVKRFVDDDVRVPPSTKNSPDMHLRQSCLSRSRLTMQTPCLSSTDVPPPARQGRRSSPLLSVLLASVGDQRGQDDNAQSILEDHLLRVYHEEDHNHRIPRIDHDCKGKEDHLARVYHKEYDAENILEDHLLRVYHEDIDDHPAGRFYHNKDKVDSILENHLLRVCPDRDDKEDHLSKIYDDGNAQSILEDHLLRVYDEDIEDHPGRCYHVEDCAQSILEDHLLRVWDETSACTLASVCTSSCSFVPSSAATCRCRHDSANSSRCA